MVKIESVELILGKTPEELKDNVRAFMLKKTEERKKNVAVSSVAFSESIKARIPVVDGKHYGVMFFFEDYILAQHEAGPAKHHPDEAEGASAIGPDTPRKRR
jgi:hypothetical protein